MTKRGHYPAAVAWLLVTCALALNACGVPQDPVAESDPSTVQPPSDDVPDEYATLRSAMVREQMKARDIRDPRVLQAMQTVPRHRFVAEGFRHAAYADRPLPIPRRQTISQPYIVALMTQLANVEKDSKVLDIGTGSGYQAAVLAELCEQVYSIEIIESLARDADRLLKELGYHNIEVRAGDGYRGWPEHAPFDAIIVAAAPDHVPQPLVDQLAIGGRLVIPVGDAFQTLLVIQKQPDGSTKRHEVAPVAFVPMTGEAEERK